MRLHLSRALVVASAGAVSCGASGIVWGCASCGCTLSTDAATGYSTLPGFRVTLEYDYINQDQLRRGTHKATPAQVVNNPAEPGATGGEIEKQTINQYVTAGLSYSPNFEWNFKLLIPYVVRSHTTYGDQDAPYTQAQTAPGQISGAHVSDLGDMRLIASWQGLLPAHNLGLQLGVKLPTGHYGAHVNFNTGPNAGTPLDASLQPGTGSTDIILGAYYYRPISRNFEAFVNAQLQSSVQNNQDRPDNDFRPGNSQTVSFGVRYEAHPQWVPQLQINVIHKSPDQGALADLPDTAGTVAYISPGVTVQAIGALHVFAFVQVPVYSNLDGYQVFPRWTGSVGGAYSF
jgi:hypothetical protein